MMKLTKYFPNPKEFSSLKTADTKVIFRKGKRMGEERLRIIKKMPFIMACGKMVKWLKE